MGGVFISYRRDDSQGSTARVADRLHQLLGDEIPLFLDIDSIRPGQDFRQVIAHTLTQCDVTLVMVGPRWLEVTDEDGNLRLADPSDLHRLEVESALMSSATVIPVLVEGAAMPSPGELPESIRDLAYLHAAEVSVRRFASDAEYLAELIRSVVTPEEVAPPPAPEQSPPPPPVPPTAPSAAGPEQPSSSPATPAPTPPATAEHPHRRGGPDRRLLMGGGVAALLALVVVVISLTGGDDDQDTPTTTTAATTGVGAPEGVDVFSLEVGDCFGPVDGIPVVSVEPADCSGLHINEVYAIWNSFTATLPSDDDLLAGCLSRFDDAVGIPYQFSSYFVGGFWPDEELWAAGNRTVICYGFVRDGQGAVIATTGSMLGSGN